MCKKFIVFVFCASVLFSGAAMAELDDSGRLIVPATSVAPVIDGELDDVWQDASEESLLITEIINAGGNVPPDDDSDLSGTFKVMYDDDNFYFFLGVQDSVLDFEFSDWQGDSVEIYFDGDNNKGGAYDGVNDNQIRINTDDVALGDTGSSLPIDGTNFAVLQTDTGYNIEVAFPLSVLQLVPEQTFGFEVQLNDNDGGGARETMIRWFSDDNNSWQDSSLFGEAVLAASAPEPTKPSTDGLVAMYAMDGDSNDGSGNELNGTLVGDPAFVEGKVGMALDLDGVDDLVEIGKFDVVGHITLAAWIKPDDFGINDARIITKAQEWGQDDHWWMLSTISETSLRFRLKTDEGPSTAQLISDPVLEAGVFAHVAATWDGNTMRLYKDGVEVASQEKGGTAVAVDPDISAAIGSQPSDAFASDPSHVVKFFDGLIDDVRIYDRALSDGEVMYLAGLRATPVNPGTTGLAAFYKLENDTLDSSGNGNDGTIVGAPTSIDGPTGYGMAMEFHGLGAPGGGGDYIDCGNDASLDIAGPISIGLWIKPGADDPEGQGTETAPMAKAMSGAGWSWQVRYGWGSPQPYMAFTFNTSPRAWAYVGQNLEKDEWTHIACSHDGETLKCYLDGEETDSTPMGQITSSEAPVLIGSDGWGCDWIGAIDEVVIYDRDLSAGEIRYLAGIRENLVLNPSFEEDEAILDDPDWAQWATWNPAEGAGSNATIVDTDAVDGARSLRIEPIGAENWYFIVLYLPMMVDMDKDYVTSFWAKAEADRPLTVQMKAEDNSINAWGATTFDLTTEWAEYSYTSEVLIDVIKLEILCAGSEAPFLLDLVSVVEADMLSISTSAP